MKTSIQTIFSIAAFVLFTSAAVANNNTGNDPEKRSSSKSVVLSDQEIDDMIGSLELEDSNWLNDTITYNIYDASDELVYSKQVQRNEPINDERLVKLLGQSDLLMTFENSSYYRLSEH